MRLKSILILLLITHSSTWLLAQDTAAKVSRTDGLSIYYYATLHEALLTETNTNTSIDSPVEITILTDITLDEPLIIEDGVHIRLITGNADVTIRRCVSNIEFPVIWVTGDSASLSLGKPGMEYELFIDGGYKNDPPIEAFAPLIAVNGPDSKLIMYDNVTLQNNSRIGQPPGTTLYQAGAGVFIRTAEDLTERQAEFIMKGGTIRGIRSITGGTAVNISGFGLFTMEGGVIKDNIATTIGGGFSTGSRGSFRKTGGIIYGSNAPEGLRNIALEGLGSPKSYGHAVIIVIFNPAFQYRNDTVGENDNLSYIGMPRGNGIFGEGDKWDNPDKALIRLLSVIILTALILLTPLTIITIKFLLKKRFKKIQTEYSAPQIDYEKFGITSGEKKICELLLTELSAKEISKSLNLSYSTINFHTQNLYRKLEIQSRTELFVKLGMPKSNTAKSG
ncbi:MAG: helix-turn-helix transcriptional regulator [Treponema sp.]|nr:helix-turn-helix transcriptional regulator [Treponema sp.]